MKLITNANLELIIQEFYALLQEEFYPKQLKEAKTLTIGETGKKFDGSQDVFWSLNEIGAAHKNDVGSVSNLTTSNKSNVVAAINELQNNKASIAYVNDAISNVEIEDVVTASEFIGNIEDIENDYVTQAELEDALANLDDIDIEGMVTAVDVGNVNIEQGGSNNGGSFDLSNITMYDIKAYSDHEAATVGTEIDAIWRNCDSLWDSYNELFQSANNGKELIASAIGEPLNAEDTFSAMSNDINGLLNTFKTNMMNNGVTVNSSDRFKQLIDKISTMVEEGSGKGIQFTEGVIPNKLELAANMSTVSDVVEMNLDFTPTYIFILCSSYYNSNLQTHTVTLSNVLFSNISNCTMESTMKGYVNIENINSNNFTVTLNTNYVSKLQVDKWYAIGVGEEDTTLRNSLASILQQEGVSVSNEDDMASLISKVDSEFDRQVVPQGTATINDVISGKTFINSTGQLLTGTASKGLSTATGTVNVSSTIYTSKSSFTINANFTPTRLILIIPRVWYNSGVIEHQNVIVTNETTTLNAGPNENGTIKVSSMTSYSFNIQMSGLQIPSCTITWIAIG